MATACDTGTTSGPGEFDDVLQAEEGDPIRGASAFEAECAKCHATGDGADLAFFAFPDTTIVRRALGHVDEATARDLVAYIRTLEYDGGSRHMRLFQPGGEVLEDDVALPLTLFGEDGWPADLSPAELASMPAHQIPTAVMLPEWSVEQSNVDWMPSQGLPDGILHYDDSRVFQRLELYRERPTEENLVEVVKHLFWTAHRRDNPAAACNRDNPATMDHALCFDVLRWASSLVAQHMFRTGRRDPMHARLHDVWWETGQFVRRALTHDNVAFENGLQNWVSWMWLGWMFGPGEQTSFYIGQGLKNMGLPRHATFVALRSQVAREPGSHRAYDDASTAASNAPAPWTYGVVRFSYRHLLELARAGVRPEPDRLDRARDRVVRIYKEVEHDVGAAQAAELAGMRDELLALLR